MLKFKASFETIVKHITWIIKITLVIDFGFLFINCGSWWGPTNGTLSFHESRFSDRDTIRHQTLSHVKEFILTFPFQVTGMQNFRHKCSVLGANPQAITSYFHFQMSPLQLGNYNNNAFLCKFIYMTMKKRCKVYTNG